MPIVGEQWRAVTSGGYDVAVGSELLPAAADVRHRAGSHVKFRDLALKAKLDSRRARQLGKCDAELVGISGLVRCIVDAADQLRGNGLECGLERYGLSR